MKNSEKVMKTIQEILQEKELKTGSGETFAEIKITAPATISVRTLHEITTSVCGSYCDYIESLTSTLTVCQLFQEDLKTRGSQTLRCHQCLSAVPMGKKV